MKTYDPDKVSITFNSVGVEGFSEDDAIVFPKKIMFNKGSESLRIAKEEFEKDKSTPLQITINNTNTYTFKILGIREDYIEVYDPFDLIIQDLNGDNLLR